MTTNAAPATTATPAATTAAAPANPAAAAAPAIPAATLPFLQRALMLTDKGYRDLKSAILACTLTNFALFLPIAVSFQLIIELLAALNGTPIRTEYLCLLFVEGIAAAVVVFIAGKNDYKKTYTASYLEAENSRIRVAEHLRGLPMSVFNSRGLTELTTSVMGDVATSEHVLSHIIPQISANAISTTVICVLMAFFDWRLALSMFCMMPVAFLVIFISRRIQDALSKRQVASRLEASAQVQEYLDGIKVIKACNLDGERFARLKNALIAMRRLSIKLEFGTGVFVTGAQALLQAGVGITVFVGSYLITAGQIELLPLLMCLLVVTRIYGPILTELTLLPELLYNIVATERTRRLMGIATVSGDTTAVPDGFDIVLRDVSFAYNEGAEQAISDVSMRINQGSVVALVGPSGSGKSTVSRLIARFWDVDAGSISIGGLDVCTLDPEHLMEYLSFVFQDVVLFNDTVFENIRIGKHDASRDEVLAAARAARCDEFVSRMPDGYDTLLGENGATLSGGERQRLSIARALLKDAPVILLDEATASLDPENEAAIQEALSLLVRGKTVLVIAHRLRTVASADCIYVLESGRVVQSGSHDALMAAGGLYRDMFLTQQESLGWSV
jgi:ATP-binding cassette subfamily B protein